MIVSIWSRKTSDGSSDRIFQTQAHWRNSAAPSTITPVFEIYQSDQRRRAFEEFAKDWTGNLDEVSARTRKRLLCAKFSSRPQI